MKNSTYASGFKSFNSFFGQKSKGANSSLKPVNNSSKGFTLSKGDSKTRGKVQSTMIQTLAQDNNSNFPNQKAEK